MPNAATPRARSSRLSCAALCGAARNCASAPEAHSSSGVEQREKSSLSPFRIARQAAATGSPVERSSDLRRRERLPRVARDVGQGLEEGRVERDRRTAGGGVETSGAGFARDPRPCIGATTIRPTPSTRSRGCSRIVAQLVALELYRNRARSGLRRDDAALERGGDDLDRPLELDRLDDLDRLVRRRRRRSSTGRSGDAPPE